jgi:triosephosphate isomerase
MAKKLVYGNLKMTDSGDVADQLTQGLASAKIPADVEVVVFPPATDLSLAAKHLEGKPVMLGGQTCGTANEGAYTGDISPKRLGEAGCKYVIIGQSERRGGGESNEHVKKAAEAAIEAGMTPIICIGESRTDREAGRHLEVVKAQLEESIPDAKYNGQYKVAYEPIWAIGKDALRSAEKEEILEMHAMIKDVLPAGKEGSKPDVLYGGSVTGGEKGTAGWILPLENVDGVLVGGASKKLETFLPIIEEAGKAAAQQVAKADEVEVKGKFTGLEAQRAAGSTPGNGLGK